MRSAPPDDGRRGVPERSGRSPAIPPIPTAPALAPHLGAAPHGARVQAGNDGGGRAGAPGLVPSSAVVARLNLGPVGRRARPGLAGSGVVARSALPYTATAPGTSEQGLLLHLAHRVAGQPFHHADLARALVHRQSGGDEVDHVLLVDALADQVGDDALAEVVVGLADHG